MFILSSSDIRPRLWVGCKALADGQVVPFECLGDLLKDPAGKVCNDDAPWSSLSNSQAGLL